MPATLLRSGELVKAMEADLLGRSRRVETETGQPPALLSVAAVRSIGREAIGSYRAGLTKRFARVGARIEVVDLETEPELWEVIAAANTSGAPGGTMLKLPLAKGMNPSTLVRAIEPRRDVDGMSGRADAYPPATPRAMRALAEYALGCSLANRPNLRVGVVGHGRLVGAPLVAGLRDDGIEPHALVTLEDPDAASLLPDCDVIFSATGSESIRPEHIHPNRRVIVVDAGVRVEGGVLRGDAHPALHDMPGVVITPVTGGVGPLTSSFLAEHTVHAAERQLGWN